MTFSSKHRNIHLTIIVFSYFRSLKPHIITIAENVELEWFFPKKRYPETLKMHKKGGNGPNSWDEGI